MAITEAQVIVAVESALDGAALLLPGHLGIVAGILAKVSRPIFEAIEAGSDAGKLTIAIQNALRAASDDEMKATLGP